MATRLTESRLRQIIREEARRLVTNRRSLRESDRSEFYDIDEPGMQGIPDAATVAEMIIRALGGDAEAKTFYNDCMFNSDPEVDRELEAYIEEFGGGALDSESEDDQMEVLEALAYSLGGKPGTPLK